MLRNGSGLRKLMMQNILEFANGKLDLSAGTAIMGILNVTPDSFSDGGRYFDPKRAVAHGLKLVREGAAIIDVGPESSRPGSERVCVSEQIGRAAGVIEELSSKCDALISVDTYDADVARACIDAGASIVNDITAGRDERMFRLCADRGVAIVLMHMQGMPDSMQENPSYDDVVEEVLGYLISRTKAAMAEGVEPEKIILDPGIGFGKTVDHNIILLKNLKRFVETGFKVLVGASRKSFIGLITGREIASDRDAGTIATTAISVMHGVHIVRVHDVAGNLDAAKVSVQLR